MLHLLLKNFSAFLRHFPLFFPPPASHTPSSETQGLIKGARESLNGRKNIYGTKKSKGRREEPLGNNVLRDQFQTVAAVLASDWCQKNTSFVAPIRIQNGGDHLELIWYHSGPLFSRAAVPLCPTRQARFLFSFYRLFFLSTVSLLVECLSTSSCREEGLAQRTESRV